MSEQRGFRKEFMLQQTLILKLVANALEEWMALGERLPDDALSFVDLVCRHGVTTGLESDEVRKALVTPVQTWLYPAIGEEQDQGWMRVFQLDQMEQDCSVLCPFCYRVCLDIGRAVRVEPGVWMHMLKLRDGEVQLNCAASKLREAWFVQEERG